MKKQIEIRHGDVYCTKISSIYNKDDFFYEAYGKAAQAVRDVVEATEYFYEKRDGRREGNGSERAASDWRSGVTEYMHLAGYPNNIIAFCAGRGQGKTSAMISFSTALRQWKKSEEEQQFWGDPVKDCRFYVLEPIDPTMMNQRDSILRIVISRMFECYAREEKDLRNSRYSRPEGEPKLLNGFRQCYRSLDVLQKERDLQDCYDDLENLADLGDSSHLKRTFQELVSDFLDLVFQQAEGKKHQFLIIQIDDADLNATNAYRIVEELRKYCVVPNVLILMATDLEQLELTVEQHFIEEMEVLCRYKSAGKTVWDHCHKMMERYLDKLIPGTRQIHLPLINHYIKDYENELRLQYTDGNGKTRSGDYQDVLLKMIFQKTGLILVKSTGYLHNLLPKTMRELTHMLAFLTDLKDLDSEKCALSQIIRVWRKIPPKAGEPIAEPRLSETGEAALELRRNNVDALMIYLRHCWAKAALMEDQQAVIAPVMEAAMDLKIKQLTLGLKAYGAKKYPDTWTDPVPGDNFQYADVISVLNKLKAMPNCTDEFTLIYISATILTLYMHLLVIQDLKAGLEFKHLKEFMGNSVFPPEVGRFEWKGLRYDQLDIGRNLIQEVVGADLSSLNANTRTAAQLLLTNPTENTGGQANIALEGIPLGSQAAVLEIFNNCLNRTAHSENPEITTEILDIILSWDLQYYISKELERNNKGKENKPSLYYDTWVLQQFKTMDEVYKQARMALGIETTSEALETAFSEERLFLVALALGSKDYAEQWWQEIKASLKEDLRDVENALGRLEKDDGEEIRMQVLKQCEPKLRTLGRSGSRGYAVSIDRILSNKALFGEKVTPQDVINRAAETLRLPAESTSWGESDGEQELKFWQSKAQNIDQILAQIKTCQGELDSIELYFQQVNRRQMMPSKSTPAVQYGKRTNRRRKRSRR